VENDTGGEGRRGEREREREREREKEEKRFNLCPDNAALFRQIIIHEPIYIIPCTGALSYHSCALKYRFLCLPPPRPPARPPPPPPHPFSYPARCILQRGYSACVYAIDKRNCDPAASPIDASLEVLDILDARRTYFRYVQRGTLTAEETSNC